MRGKPSTRGLQGTRRRIIPAHAGQTTSGLPGSVTSSDHPRACGANVEMHASLGSHVGSSPRMRGKLICRFCRRCRMRIIPAHAGQTTRTTSCPARYPDHPRACGANLGKIGSLFGSFGSSPRMRGKRRPRPCPRTPVRIIPAHAGQTCVCSIESGPCERVDVFHVSGRFWSTSACGEKRTPARPAWTSFPS